MSNNASLRMYSPPEADPPLAGNDADSIKLLFVGDIMLSRSVGAEMRKREDYAYPFRLIVDAIRSADIAFGNLEGPISSRGENQGSAYSFRAEPYVARGLKFAGFDVLSLANNHIMDWGPEALEDTVRFLKEADILSVGAGSNMEEANASAVLCAMFRGSTSKQRSNLTGCAFRVAFLAYTNLYPEGLIASEDSSGVSDSRIENILERVRKAREEADIVVVSYHWGEEYVSKPSEEQRELARAIIDAGADLVIGHHSHVAQEVEKYENGWIAYGLGNFVFDQNFSKETMGGLMLRAFVRDRRISRIEGVPIRISETFQPYVVE